MDLFTFMKLYKQKTGRDLNINELIRAMNGDVDTFNDTGRGRGYGSLFEQKFWETNDPSQLGDQDRKDRLTGEYEDYNVMYNRLNDLYRVNPEMHREAQKRLLDQGLGNDLNYNQQRLYSSKKFSM